jgi:heme-degrading monooxygenase HmoA
MTVIEVRSRFRVVNGMEDQVRAAFQGRPRLVDREPGFVAIEVLQHDADRAVFELVTRWTDRASFEAWHGSPAHRASHELIPKGLKLDPAYTRVDVLVPVDLDGGRQHGEDQKLVTGLVEANNALAVAHRELAQQKKALEQAHAELKDAHWHIRRVQELLPICMRCHRVKDHQGQWETLVDYMRKNTDFLSHGCCPSCKQHLLGEWGLT